MAARSAAPKREKKTRSSLAARLAAERAGEVGSSSSAKTHLSKSAMKRQKHRAREQLAGSKEGLRELSDMMTSIEEELPASKADDTNELSPHLSITAKSRRAMLARERQRQPHIFADLARVQNPFAALRTHARNTLEFARAPTVEKDEAME